MEYPVFGLKIALHLLHLTAPVISSCGKCFTVTDSNEPLQKHLNILLSDIFSDLALVTFNKACSFETNGIFLPFSSNFNFYSPQDILCAHIRLVRFVPFR